MKWYIFCRSGLILFVIILVWLFTNIFVNVPPDFHKLEGNVIHKEFVSADTKQTGDGKVYNYETYSFAYITKSGKIINDTHKFKKGSDYYDEFIKNDKYYRDNIVNIGIFVFLCVYSFFGFLLTLLVGNDMNEYFSCEKDKRIRGRNMRINHFKIVSDFYGYDNEQDREDTYAAIEEFREHDDAYKKALYYGTVPKIPKWSYMINEISHKYDGIIADRKCKETNITDGEKVGGFSD